MSAASTTSGARGRGRSGAAGANVSDRRAEILATAAEIFARKGYVNATVREIADASGILAGSLYHHFESKEAMVDEILSTFLTTLVGRYEAVIAAGDDVESTLRTLVHVQFEGLIENRAAITLANNDSYYLQQIPRFAYLQETGAHIARLWVGVLQRGVDEGVFRADVDPEMVWVFIKGAIWATVQYLSDGGPTASQTIADSYLAVLFDGVKAT
ncbi:TetR/AcrR family transcriptional regulator [Rhabdothermincola salaria]|uniref:TetR/AcrR family transcriptional regulator n=1 Tax=Rhabdothermincola salaria TaxID=2903142 RepID=UPI001E5A1B1B|nr:TetR/AcrR family transcriptional regulator [Rhabdothermincola salaria]